MILDHGNGYFTRYAHLAHIGSGPGATLPAQVGPGDVIGVMGSTGNSYGAHLHFAVHRDDGNGRWDGGEQDKPVDPFGWTGVQPDPWAQSEDGAASRWLWLHRPNVEMFVFGSQGATLADLAGAIAVTLPPGALSGQVRLELAPGSPAGLPQDAQRSLGRAFWLRVLDWYAPGAQTGTDALAAQLDQAMTARPLALALDYADADTRRLDMTRAIVQRWDEASQTWLPLPTSVDERTRTVTAEANQLGHFDLQAPLRCPPTRWSQTTATMPPPISAPSTMRCSAGCSIRRMTRTGCALTHRQEKRAACASTTSPRACASPPRSMGWTA